MHLSSEKMRWDPAGVAVSFDTFKVANRNIEAKYEEYRGKSDYPRECRNWLFFGGILGAAFILWFLHFSGAFEEDFVLVFVAFLAFIPLLAYIRVIKVLQRDLIKLVIAKENDWVYSPDENVHHWRKMSVLFPGVFRKGDEKQNLQDEFWGKFTGNRGDVDFWSGIFKYTKVSYDSKGRKSESEYTKTAFSFHLEKQLNTSFQLEPENIGTKVLNLFRKKEIEIESSEFNKHFAFFYNGKKGDREFDIVKVLSPAIQVRLLELQKHEGDFSVLFQGDVVVFLFDGLLLEDFYTDFFKKVEVDERDKKVLWERLENILEISDDIVQFLD